MQVTLWWVLHDHKRTKDLGYKIVLETWELSADQVLGIHGLYNKAVYVILGENPIDELPDDLESALQQWVEKKHRQKSPSKRLREVLYVYRDRELRQPGQESWDFQVFYEKTIEKLIAHYQKQLE